MVAAHWTTTVTAPHYISDAKSDVRGIKPGWYGIEDKGNLSSGPFSSREECVKRITQPTSPSEFIELSTAQMRKQFDIVSAQNKELFALAQEVATEASEPIKTGVSKAFNKAT